MKRSYILGYDIREPKRLAKIHKTMVQFACPIEYSIFLFYGGRKQLEELLKRVIQLMDLQNDDLRCYELPIDGFQRRIGKATLPLGIVWTGLPSPCLSTFGGL